MLNNFKALMIHLCIVFFTFIFIVIFVATGPTIGQYTTHIIGRFLITSLFLLIYVFAGTFLDTSKDKKYDFLNGVFIGIIGVWLFTYTLSITGGDLLSIPEEASKFWIPMNLYQMPFTMIRFLIPIPNIPILSIIENIIPSLLIGLGMKYKRYKLIRES